MSLTVVDFFAGGGGASEGLTQAGWHITAAVDHWPIAVATHQANHPNTTHYLADLSNFDMRRLPYAELLWGSPSCVWHALAGGRKKPPAEQERARADAGSIDRATAFAIIAAAEVHRYPLICVENVPEFAAWSLYPWWLDGLRALGYTVTPLVLDAADYGHAQRRKRLFLIATRDGLHVDLTPPRLAAVPASAILDADPGRPVTRRLYVADQLDEIREDGVPHLVTWRRHAHARRADQHPIASVTAGGNHHGVAVRLDGVMHSRMLTNRECARAQGFGDGYAWVGSAAEVKRQIGNAVPVGIARWIGQRAAEALGVAA